MKVKRKIIKLIRKEAYRPLTFEELLGLLESQAISAKELEKALNLMEKEGSIVKTRRGAYGLPGQMNLIVGYLQANRKGFGFVKSEEGEARISSYDLNGAIHGDKVAVRLSKKRGSSDVREGEVVHILERAHKTIVGRFEKKGKV
ncbi:MAG: hypothetical protein Q8M92_08640, partial [Candidatus Subteraquimicrobiales bacterium]|nr:hypothetical protein [Candidatus Subteraquimicrobiales bacterium]